jgi:hypothetical protein
LTYPSALRRGFDDTWEIKSGWFLNQETGKATQDVKTARGWFNEGESVFYDRSTYRYNPQLGAVRSAKTVVYRTLPEWKALDEYKEDAAKFRKWKEGKSTNEREYEWERLCARWRTIVARNAKKVRSVEVWRKKKHLVVNVNFTYQYTRMNRAGETITRSKEQNLVEADYVPREDMDDDEICRDVIDAWVMRSFGSESPVENIEIGKYHVGFVGDVSVSKLPMAGLSLLYPSLTEVSTNEGQCVVDYLLWEAKKGDSKKVHWTRPFLVETLGETPNTETIIRFAETENVSVYALDMLMKVVDQFSAKKPSMWLFFIVNNGHLYPITNTAQRLQIREVNELRLDEIPLSRWDVERAEYSGYADDESALESVQQAGAVLVLNIDNLDKVCALLMKRTGTIVEKMTWSNCVMTAFENPINKRIVIAGADWEVRKELCETYFDKTHIEDFVFRNQGFPSIARSLLTNLFASIPRSEYSPHYQRILKEYPIRAYRMMDEDVERSGCMSFDINKCFTDIALTMDTPYPVFGAFDYVRAMKAGIRVEDLPAGEYYVAKTFYMGRGTIKVSRGVYPLCVVKYFVKRGYITMSNITYGKKASRSISCDVLRGFVEFVVKEHPQMLKELVNHLVGSFGSLYSRTDRTGITDNYDTMIATSAGVAGRQNKVRIHPVGDLYVVREVEEVMKVSGDLPINRAIVGMSIVKLDMMIDTLNLTDIVGYNTDSVKVRGQDIDESKFGTAIGAYRRETKCSMFGHPMQMLPEHPEWNSISKPVLRLMEGKNEFKKTLLEQGGLVCGMAGCGKTTLLKELLMPKSVVMTFTNAATENLKARGVEAHTFDSFMMGRNVGKHDPSKLAEFDYVLIDEYTMLPVSYMALLVRAQRTYGFKVICFGDWKQCVSIGEYVEFHTNPVFLEMCGNVVVQMKYKEGYARYDSAMYLELLGFDKTSKLSSTWFREVPKTYSHLCLTNPKREALNRDCFARWIAETESEVIDVGGMPVCVGLPVTVYHDTDKSVGFFKTQDWFITSVDKEKVHLSRNGEARWIFRKEFRAMFDYAFAKTTHKAQGITISGKYVIWESDRMSKNTLNTALSRGTCLENVIVAGKPSGRTFKPDGGSGCGLMQMKDLAVKLSTGRIYRVRLGGLTYVGRTIQTLAKRLEEHRVAPTNSRMKALFKTEQGSIELVFEFQYVAEKVFADVEKEYIQREVEECGDILNFQHNRVPLHAIVAKKGQLERVEVIANKKFQVKDDPSKNRFEVCCSAKNVDKEDMKVRFAYARREKEIALKEAEAHSIAMRKKYY